MLIYMHNKLRVLLASVVLVESLPPPCQELWEAGPSNLLSLGFPIREVWMVLVTPAAAGL